MNFDCQYLVWQIGIGCSYFIEWLFCEVVFGECGLVGINLKVECCCKWLIIGVLSVIVLVVLVVMVVWIVSYCVNQSYIVVVDQCVDLLVCGIELLSLVQCDVLVVLLQFNVVQNFVGDVLSWVEGYGLYQGDMFGEEFVSVYCKLLIVVFVLCLVICIEEQLCFGGSSDFFYEGLKVYLMFGSLDYYDVDFIKVWISFDWECNLLCDFLLEQCQVLYVYFDVLFE